LLFQLSDKLLDKEYPRLAKESSRPIQRIYHRKNSPSKQESCAESVAVKNHPKKWKIEVELLAVAVSSVAYTLLRTDCMIAPNPIQK
jgi:hypothetical protein